MLIVKNGQEIQAMQERHYEVEHGLTYDKLGDINAQLDAKGTAGLVYDIPILRCGLCDKDLAELQPEEGYGE